MLEVTMKTIDRLIRSNKLESKTFAGEQKERVLVRLKSIEKMKLLKTKGISIEKASKILGVGKPIIVTLINERIIKRVEVTNRDTKRSINIDSVNDLLNTFSYNSSINNNPTDDFMPLSVVAKLGEKNQDSISVIKYVLQNKLTPILQNEEVIGLNKYYFEKNEVRKLFEKEKQHNHLSNYMNIPRVSKTLGLQYNSANYLVKNGFINLDIIDDKRLVSINSLNEYKKKYSTTSELARKHNLDVKTLTVHLKKQGIFPINKLPIKKGQPRVYKLTKDLVDAIKTLKLTKKSVHLC